MATTSIGAGEIIDFNISSIAAVSRSKMAQRALAKLRVKLTDARIFDTLQVLPTAGTGTQLGLVARSFGTNACRIETGDVKNTSTTRYCRLLIPLPEDYQATETVVLRVGAGMDTTVASSSATVDVEAYRHVGDGTIGADLCSTAAQSCNNLTASDKDFNITPTTLLAGDLLDVRLTLAVVDVATATVVNAVITKVEFQADLL